MRGSMYSQHCYVTTEMESIALVTSVHVTVANTLYHLYTVGDLSIELLSFLQLLQLVRCLINIHQIRLANI